MFWVLAAGKNGTIAAKNLQIMLKKISILVEYGLDLDVNLSPFELIKLADDYKHRFEYNENNANWLAIIMYWCGIGCYNRKSQYILGIINSGLNLRTCTVDDLEQLKGIGKKTSRCFIIHTRQNAQYAGLDVHALQLLREHNVANVPKTTPSSKKEYDRLEKEFLKLVPDGISVAEFDLNNWNKRKNKVGINTYRYELQTLDRE